MQVLRLAVFSLLLDLYFVVQKLQRGENTISVHERDVFAPACRFQLQVSVAEGRTPVPAASADRSTTSCVELNSKEKAAMYLAWKLWLHGKSDFLLLFYRIL